MRVAGVMSGTSLDGIDVAVVEVAGRRVRSIGFRSTPYPGAVRRGLLEVSNATAHTGAISRLNFQLGELYAKAVLGAVRRFGPVELIGCHGQTIYHEGGRNTMQIGEPAVLAERTGVPVVSGFRARDIAAGGQGAPLVPFVDYLLFRHARRTRIALNIGGIANITVIPPAARPEDVAAFDTGPGNMAIDALAREYSEGKLDFDRGGKIAASGKVNRALLDELLSDAYYRRKPPKSAGREQYGAEFVSRLKESGLPMRDLIATATVLTAATIAMGIESAIDRSLTVAARKETVAARREIVAARRGGVREVAARRIAAGAADLIVSGGGVHNPQIMAYLAGFLPGVRIAASNDFGIDADAKEAIAFAVLAYYTSRRKASNLPSATGARGPVVLGNLTP